MTRKRPHKTRCGLATATSRFTTRSPRQESPSSTWAQGTPTRARLSRVVSSRRSKSRALLNESPGAGYLERRWAEPFKKSGAWPISALRQAFLNGTLERLLEPDSYLESEAAGVRHERRLRLRIGRERRRLFAGLVQRVTAAGGNQLRFRCVPAATEEGAGAQGRSAGGRGSAAGDPSDCGRR